MKMTAAIRGGCMLGSAIAWPIKSKPIKPRKNARIA